VNSVHNSSVEEMAQHSKITRNEELLPVCTFRCVFSYNLRETCKTDARNKSRHPSFGHHSEERVQTWPRSTSYQATRYYCGVSDNEHMDELVIVAHDATAYAFYPDQRRIALRYTNVRHLNLSFVFSLVEINSAPYTTNAPDLARQLKFLVLISPVLDLDLSHPDLIDLEKDDP
jgi:hypothetical protein